MKTKHLIEILRCPADDTVRCNKCENHKSCVELAQLNTEQVVADRLEALLENLRRTEAELKDYRFQAQLWEKRHKRFLNDIREAVREQEIITGL